MNDRLDKQLRNTFSQAQVTMPADLQAKLMAIPEAEKVHALARYRKVYAVAASIAIISLFGGTLLRIIDVASHTVGGWGMRLISGSRGVIYEALMPKVSPWIESVPLSPSQLTMLLMVLTVATLTWAVLRQSTGRPFVLNHHS